MFTPEEITKHAPSLSTFNKIWIAFSGGLDSTVLLYTLFELKQSEWPNISISALHANHNLQDESGKWQEHCQKICDDLKIPIHCINLDVQPIKGESLENVARIKRYDFFRNYIKANECLLTAHHADDQVETVLLRLIKGAGIHGLRAIRTKVPFGSGFLIRPLLDFSRLDLEDYAKNNKLKWIDDPSNKDDRFDRNYLRNQVIPKIKERWPFITKTVLRSARHCATGADLIDEMALHDYKRYYVEKDKLSISSLKKLSSIRAMNMIRYHLNNIGFELPSTKKIEQIIEEVINSRDGSNPKVIWHKYCVRKHNDKLYFLMNEQEVDTKNIHLALKLGTALTLPHDLGIINSKKTYGKGLVLSDKAKLYISFRKGGEKIRLPNAEHLKSLKNLFNEWKIPHWERSKIPLLYDHEKLVAVVSFCISDDYKAKDNDDGWDISLTR